MERELKMKIYEINRKVTVASLAFLISASHVVSAMENDITGPLRNNYETILREIEELTARIHREVNQVLADYKRDTAEYHRRMGITRENQNSSTDKPKENTTILRPLPTRPRQMPSLPQMASLPQTPTPPKLAGIEPEISHPSTLEDQLKEKSKKLRPAPSPEVNPYTEEDLEGMTPQELTDAYLKTFPKEEKNKALLSRRAVSNPDELVAEIMNFQKDPNYKEKEKLEADQLDKITKEIKKIMDSPEYEEKIKKEERQRLNEEIKKFKEEIKLLENSLKEENNKISSWTLIPGFTAEARNNNAIKKGYENTKKVITDQLLTLKRNIEKNEKKLEEY